MTLYFHSNLIDNYELSNFYPHSFKTHKNIPKIKIIFEGQNWSTSEHIYQALKFKCETEDEKKWREIIRTSSTPYISKYLGNFFTGCKYGWQAIS